MNKYDYVIIGAGPSGLIVGYLLGKQNKKVLIIDQNKQVGGCHRVTRVNSLFTEHGPRMYMSGFINTKNILKSMNLTFTDLFTPYDFGLASGINIFKTFTMKELFILTYSFIKLTLNSDYGKRISVYNFATTHNFSKESLNQMDKLCRLTDGADAKRFSIHEFLNLLNQNTFYNSYQPKQPNDISLFPKMLSAFPSTVTFQLNTKVTRLTTSNNKITSLTTNNKTIYASNFIMAIPPLNMYDLLDKSNLLNVFNLNLRSFVENSLYAQYIPITFHWNKKIQIPKLWGFPESDWGVVSITLSDYMTFSNKNSKTVITTCISLLDTKSKRTNKTANETSSKDKLIKEVFEQVKEKYGLLPSPTHSILHPNVKRLNNEWIETDSAYMATPTSTFVPFETKIDNLYNVGTHNGKSSYAFTSMESAITNAIMLYNLLTKSNYSISSMWQLTDVIQLLFLISITFLIVYLVKGKGWSLK